MNAQVTWTRTMKVACAAVPRGAIRVQAPNFANGAKFEPVPELRKAGLANPGFIHIRSPQ